MLSPLYTKSKKGGPRPHCLSDNWDVKPFTKSSGEASNLKIKKQKKEMMDNGGGQNGGGEEESTTQTLRNVPFSC